MVHPFFVWINGSRKAGADVRIMDKAKPPLVQNRVAAICLLLDFGNARIAVMIRVAAGHF